MDVYNINQCLCMAKTSLGPMELDLYFCTQCVMEILSVGRGR